MAYVQLSKGSLIIASPDIDTGLYFRSVILICEHGPTGTFGLLINKPLEIELPEEALHLKEVSNPQVKIQSGGPLQPQQMMVIHSFDQLPEQTLKLCEGVFLGGDMQFLQEALTQSQGPSIRLCFGYCGWGPAQLEKEFMHGLWFLQLASARYVFDTPPEKVWKSVLGDMGGKYATLSMIPDDLSLN